jgi:hypothetical protein
MIGGRVNRSNLLAARRANMHITVGFTGCGKLIGSRKKCQGTTSVVPQRPIK